MKLGILLMVAALAAFSQQGKPDHKQEDAASIYRHRCSRCHGADGKARGFTGKMVHATDLTSAAVQQQSGEALAEVIRNGKGRMPAFGTKLSGGEIQGLIAYVRQLGK